MGVASDCQLQAGDIESQMSYNELSRSLASAENSSFNPPHSQWKLREPHHRYFFTHFQSTRLH